MKKVKCVCGEDKFLILQEFFYDKFGNVTEGLKFYKCLNCDKIYKMYQLEKQYLNEGEKFNG